MKYKHIKALICVVFILAAIIWLKQPITRVNMTTNKDYYIYAIEYMMGDNWVYIVTEDNREFYIPSWNITSINVTRTDKLKQGEKQ